MSTSRRRFVKGAVISASAAAAAARRSQAQAAPSDTVNVGVVGFRSRGRSHIREFLRMPGVRVGYLCDIDERLFPDAVAEVERTGGYTPQTETDIRKLLARISHHGG